ncbi:NADP-dependent oxidoreductase [Saccharothrix sp. CCNWYY140]|uniref:NADP-dependent oxidoreductase n=1 Tax=unclassified Saccharothrix TaxID=2593673 RepID=UPI003FD586CF
MTKMRAILLNELGGTEVLEQVETDKPTAAPGKIVVKVHAAGVNPVDWKVREHGYWFSTPLVLGWDVSGVVTEVFPGENRFKVGDEVFGLPGFPDVGGTYAEYVTAPARHFARKPAKLDHVEAAALPLAVLTAWQALVEAANLQAGQRVLVHAAAGGVGHLAVQLAKALGAHVIGTASAGKHDLLRELGADELVDYRNEDFSAIEPVDVVLDLIGGEDYEERSLRLLKRGGTYLAVVNPTIVDELRVKAEPLGVRVETVMVTADHAALEHVARLVDEGKLRVVVAETFPLEDVGKAHELGEAGRTTGKIVLTI